MIEFVNEITKSVKRRYNMLVTICIGSSCHLKGSRQVVEELQKLIDQNNLKEEVELAGTFCMGNCQKGVSVKLNDQLFSVSPQTVKEFFENEILKK